MMKFNTFKHLTICFAAGIMLSSIAAWADVGQPAYKITFAGRGESSTVDEVVVENLSNGKSASLQGQDTLLLKSKGDLTAINSAFHKQSGDLRITGGKLQVNLKQPANVLLAIYSIDGRLAWQTRLQISSHTAAVTLPPLGKGVYIVRATAPGLKRSIKWAGSTSESLIANLSWQDSQSDEASPASDFTRSLFSTETNIEPKSVELEYATGDVLRFTGTSSQMRTITMNTPRSSHPIYFDFFSCKDSDGYNYTIVRVGDQLWMAEDLHAKDGIDGVERVAKLEDWNVASSGSPARMYVHGDDDVYYTKAAALKALPEGWTLPSQGEVDYLIGKLGGYAKAGKAMKSRGREWPSQETGTDVYSLGLTPHGDLYKGTINVASQARYLLRSTKNLKPTSLVLQDGQDNVSIMAHLDNSVGFHVRGMRSAPSAYTPMMQRFDLLPKNMPTRVKGENNGPLGDTYTMKAGMQSIAFDFGGGQYRSGDMEKRSGILSCRDKNGRDPQNFDFHHNGFAEQNDRNTLRKMTAMTSPEGRQYIVEGKWSRPMRLWTQLINGKYNVSSMKSEQGWLRVNRSQDIDTRFLWEAAVCGDCTQEINNKIIEAPMP